MVGREYGSGGKQFTDPKFGFTFIYPQVSHWKLEQTEPGFIMFVNRFLQSTVAVMASQMPAVVANIHDLEVQVNLAKGLVMSLKQMIPMASDFRFGSSENIFNPQNQVKGFKLIIHFKLSQQEMKGKYVTYFYKQIRYDILATASQQHYDNEDKIFFEPVFKSFSFEV